MKIKGVEVFGDISNSLKQKILKAYNLNKDFFSKSINIEILFVKTDVEFRNELKRICGKAEREPWVVGHASGKKIVIFYPECFNKVSNHSEEEFDFVLAHEISHCFLSEYFRHKNLLFWFVEGLPNYIASNKLPKKKTGKSPKFSKIITPKDFKAAGNPYRQSGYFVAFLVEKYGKEKVLQLLIKLRDTTESFSDLFEQVYELNLKKAEQDFIKRHK